MHQRTVFGRARPVILTLLCALASVFPSGNGWVNQAPATAPSSRTAEGPSLTAALTAARFALKWQERGPSGEDGGGYLGISHDQNINAWFGQDGVTVLPAAAGAWRTELRLKAYGYGQRLQPVPPITARKVNGNRVEYERADIADPGSGGIAVVDWYENQSAGIEQGFTLKARPVRGGDVAADEPLRLVMEVAGTLRAQVRAGDREIELVDDGGTRALTYTKLVAIDAQGKALAARMTANAEGREIALVVDDRAAAYPIVVDPILATEQVKLSPSDGAQKDLFGARVAMSGDTVVVGAHHDDVDGKADQGSVYVFVHKGTTWDQVRFSASDGKAGDQFGSAVAISGDTMIVGARYADQDSRLLNEGKAYVFTRSGPSGTWIEQKLTIASIVNPPTQAFLGSAVAISGDTMVIGAPGEGPQAVGSAYVFIRSSGVWTQQKVLRGDNVFSGFGQSVAISGDTIVVGAPDESIDVDGQLLPVRKGAAFVFVGSGANWPLQQKLFYEEGTEGDAFGYDVDIDGNRLIVGAALADVNGHINQGLIRIYERSGTAWSADFTTTGGAASDSFGTQVAIEGPTALVGAPLEDVNGNADQGAVHVYARVGYWQELDAIKAADGGAANLAGDEFGAALDIRDQRIVVGSPSAYAEALQTYPGAIYIVQPSDTDGDGLPDEWETKGVSVDDAGRVIIGDSAQGTFIDLPKMGANPLHKDIFVHLDWMPTSPAGRVLKPTARAIKMVIDTFAAVPASLVGNPDDKKGISLHIDAGAASIMKPGATWGPLTRARQVPFQDALGAPTATGSYDWSALDVAKAGGFGLARRSPAFHYVLFCNKINWIKAVLGLARDKPGADFLVAPGTNEKPATPLVQALSLMHELGHNLGLEHGGDDPLTHKPNYLSIMNYTFSTTGLQSPNGKQRVVDYSRLELPSLDEKQLREADGISDPAKHLTRWNSLTRPTVPAGNNQCKVHHDAEPLYYKKFLPSQLLDWNCDGTATAAAVQADLNADGRCVGPGPGAVLDTVPDPDPKKSDDVVFDKYVTAGADGICQTSKKPDSDDEQLQPVGFEEPRYLGGFSDWPNLVYTGGGRLGALQAGEPDAPDTVVDEATSDQIVADIPLALLDEDDAAPFDEVTAAPEEGAAPLVVSFDGSTSTAVDGTIVDWAWDFGDGTPPGSGAMVQHTYNAPGEYFASLTVTDSSGRVNLVPLLTLITVAGAPVATPTPIQSAGATPTPLRTATPIAGKTSTPTQTPLRTATPTAEPTATPERTPTSQPTAVPTATPLPATYTIDRTDDGVAAGCTEAANDCTLRGAIIKHNCRGGSDTINLPVGTYRLTVPGSGEDAALSGDLDVTAGSLTIVGEAANWTVLDGGGLDRVLHVTAGATLTVTGVTIQGGAAVAGGGILNDGGTLTVTASALVDNTASGPGGGIATRSAGATTVIADSTISGNTALDGGGIHNGAGADLQLRNSTLSGNQTGNSGGGLFTAGAVSLSNVTITENTADRTHDGSGDGGGLAISGGTASVVASNVILGGNTDRGGEAPDCAAALAVPLTLAGYTLLESTTGCTLDPLSDLTGLIVAAPDLGLLQLNGGPTETHLPNRNSPVVGVGNPLPPGSDPFACEPTDQRGIGRPFGEVCDLGAVERKAFTVTTTDDDSNDAAPTPGSLRAAIVGANARPGADTIDFDIPGAGVQTIAALTMTYIREAVVIDGYTQRPCRSNAPPCSHPNTLVVGDDASLLIELNGENARSAFGQAQGLGVFSGNPVSQGMVVVRGLVINRFYGGVVSGSNNEVVIEGNFIGTDPTGNTALGNQVGISLGEGFYAKSRSLIGGSRPAQRNVVSGNKASGVGVSSGGLNAIQGNYIGTNAAGTAVLANGSYGIGIGFLCCPTLDAVIIGGITPIPGTPPGNVVSGNGLENIVVKPSGSRMGPVAIMGNIIGPDATGTTAINIAAGGSGIEVEVGSAYDVGNVKDGPVTIGGRPPGAGNIISANGGHGIFVASAPGAVIQGNHIGTDVTGALNLGNGADGILLRSGPALCAANVIAHNGLAGVDIQSTFLAPDTTGVALSGNAIFSNVVSGIDLRADFNDSGDGDTGANNKQNFPVLTAADSAGGKTAITGSLNSTAGTTFTVEFFASPTCDDGGAGQGTTFLGRTSVTTDGNGDGSFIATFPVAVTVGSVVTATATSPPADGAATGSTSQFSSCRAVGGQAVVTTPAASTPTPRPTPLCGSATGSENCYDCIDNDGDDKVDRDDVADCPVRANGQLSGLSLPGKGAKALAKCAKTLGAVGTKFAGAKLKHLQKCVNAAFVCVQTKPTDAACTAKATGTCAKEFAKVGGDATKLRLAVSKACGPPAVAASDLQSVTGIGYDTELAVCAERGVGSLTSASDVADCLVAQHGCRVEDLVASEVPRAAELLRLAGRDPAVEFPCLGEGADGAGGDLGPVKGKLAVKCQKGIGKAGAKFASLKAKLTQKCASAVYACLQVKPTNAKCRPKATATCQKQLAKLTAPGKGAAAKLAVAIAKSCTKAPLVLEDLLADGGLRFTARAGECAALDVSSLDSIGNLSTCLERQHTCRVEQMIEAETPRLDELLDVTP